MPLVLAEDPRLVEVLAEVALLQVVRRVEGAWWQEENVSPSWQDFSCATWPTMPGILLIHDRLASATDQLHPRGMTGCRPHDSIRDDLLILPRSECSERQ